jgi:hypothetical protein
MDFKNNLQVWKNPFPDFFHKFILRFVKRRLVTFGNLLSTKDDYMHLQAGLVARWFKKQSFRKTSELSNDKASLETTKCVW